MMMVNPESARHPLSSKFSAFNPRYITSEEIEKKFQKIVSSDPLPVIKIISNHDFSMVGRIVETSYKTVFIEPVDLKKQILKVLVAKKTDSFVNKKERKKHVGSVEISSEEIIERFSYYKRHMMYKNHCDYQITDEMIQNNPDYVQQLLGLPVMKSKHNYQSFEISDEMMLHDVNEFNTLYERLEKEYEW